MGILMLSLKATSLICGSCKPIDKYPYCTKDLSHAWNWGDETVIPTANRVTSLVASCWLTPLMGGT